MTSETDGTKLTRERRISALCANGCSVAAVIVPVAVVGFWMLGSWSLLALVKLIPPDIEPDMQLAGPPHAWQRFAGAGICLVPALLSSLSFLRARLSLMAFARGDFFGSDVADGLRAYAKAGVWAAVASILSVPVLSVVISVANPPGHRELSLELSGAQALNLLAATILWVIASVMQRASRLARENAEFI